MRHKYNHWMNEAIKEYTPSGKIKRPSYSLVANWVKESWDAIDTNIIMRSFKCCGVSNAINGSEDGLIFNINKINFDISTRVLYKIPAIKIELYLGLNLRKYFYI